MSYSVDIFEVIVGVVEKCAPLNSIWQRAVKFFKSAERYNDGRNSVSCETWYTFANYLRGAGLSMGLEVYVLCMSTTASVRRPHT
jgi:hypothetical protein